MKLYWRIYMRMDSMLLWRQPKDQATMNDFNDFSNVRELSILLGIIDKKAYFAIDIESIYWRSSVLPQIDYYTVKESRHEKYC